MEERPMDIAQARGIAAQAWCADANRNTEMDTDLAEAFAGLLLEHVGVSAERVNEIDPYYEFQRDLADIINRHSIENRTDTPDFILAEYVVENLRALEHLTRAKKAWGSIPQ